MNEDAAAKPLWIGAALTLLACAVAVAVTYALLHAGRPALRAMPDTPYWYRRPPRERNEVEAHPFAASTDAEREAPAAHERLQTYGWVDRERAIVHVPIDVAIDHYLARRSR